MSLWAQSEPRMCPTAPQGHFPGVETKGAFSYTGARFTNEGLSDFDSPSQLSARRPPSRGVEESPHANQGAGKFSVGTRA